MPDFAAFIQEQPVVADGGMGTMLFNAGLERGQAPEIWNTEHPDKVEAIHRAYIDAGAQVVLSNSFGGNRLRLEMHGMGDRVTELNTAAAQIARKAADSVPQTVFVGGSIGPTGQMLEPLGTVAFDDAVAIFAEQAQALLDGGVDLFWVETMSDLEEVRAAVKGCKKVNADMPVVTTMTFDTKGRTMMGTTPEQAVEKLVSLGVVAVGANCGNGPDEVETVIEKMHAKKPGAVLIAKANAGLPRMEGTVTTYDATPADMAAYAKRSRELGAQIVGSCCGSTPEHIKAIAEALHS